GRGGGGRRGGGTEGRPEAVGQVLAGGRGRGRGHAADRVGHRGFEVRRGPVGDSRRRRRRRSDGRADLPLQADGARHLVRTGRGGRRHPCAVPFLRDGGRGLHHRGAADGGADERARRHAPLGRACNRGGGHHGTALQFHG